MIDFNPKTIYGNVANPAYVAPTYGYSSSSNVFTQSSPFKSSGSSGSVRSNANLPTSSSASAPTQSVATQSAPISSTAPTTDIYGSNYRSGAAGLRRVAAVLNPFDWGTIKLTTPNNPYGGIDVTIPTKIVTIGSEIGAAAYVSGLVYGGVATGGSTAAGLTANTGSTTLGKTGSLIAAGGIGAFIGSLFGGKQSATVTPTQTTSPIQTPTQTITPNQQTDQGSGSPNTNPTVNQSGAGTITQLTYNLSPTTNTSSSYQVTESYQINTQNTTSSQTTTTSQDQGSNMLIPALIVGAALLFSKNKR